MPFFINTDIILYENEVEFKFSRAGGPGGQNVNKVETNVELSFDVVNSSLSDFIKFNILNSNDRRITDEGILKITSKVHRTQLANKRECINKLIELILKYSVIPKKRYKTLPSSKSKILRKERKKATSEKKQLRKKNLMRNNNF